MTAKEVAAKTGSAVKNNPVTTTLVALFAALRGFNLPIPEGIELDLAIGLTAGIQLVKWIIAQFRKAA